GTLGTANNSTTYTIAPNSASLDVSVNLVNSKNEVVSQLEAPTTTIPSTKGYYNEKIGTNGEPSQTVQQEIASGKYTVTSVTVNGKVMSLSDYKTEIANGTLNAANGENHVVYNVTQDVQNTVKVQVKNPDGTIVPITSTNAGDYEGGSNLAPQTSKLGTDGAAAVTKDGTPLTTPVAPKGYHIVNVTNQVGTETPTTESDTYKVPGTLGTANNSTTYTIAPNSASLDVSVNLVNSKNEVVSQLEKPTTTIPDTKGYFNEKIGTNGEPTQTIQDGISKGTYTVVSVTVNGKTISLKDYKTEVANGTLNAANGQNHVVYNVTQAVQNTVKVQVKNPDGTIVPITSENAGNYEGGTALTPQTSTEGVDGAPAVAKDGTPLTTPVAPKGYHIVNVTNQVGTETPTTESDSYKVPGTLGTANNSTTYTIAPNSASLDVSVNLVNSKNEVVSQLEKPTTTIPSTKGYYNEKIGTNGEPTQTIQEGIASGKYTVTSVTVNGKTMSLNDYKTEVADGTLNAANGENHVVYNVT
ncbi:MAG: hypothetical protein ACRC41_12770, partial [Sarcina sp.]